MKIWKSSFYLLIPVFYYSSSLGNNLSDCDLLRLLVSAETQFEIKNAIITFGGWATLHEIALHDSVIASIAVVNHANVCYPIESPISDGIYLVSEDFHLIDGIKNECILSEFPKPSRELLNKLQVKEHAELLGVVSNRYRNALKEMFVEMDNSSFDFIFQETVKRLKNVSAETDVRLIRPLKFFDGTMAYEIESKVDGTLIYLFRGVFANEALETFWISFDEDLRFGLQIEANHFLVQKFFLGQSE